ncbi:MAG TPA: MMPL family transporter [Solirubrobacteraceae bacterium]|nr:MMPL family transporter [Solirubrobacteraceae bacterium]
MQHRRIVLAAWLIALVGVLAAKSAAGTAYRDTFKLSGTQSFDAQQLLRDSAPKAAGDTEQVVIAVEHGTVRDARVRARVQPMLQRLERMPLVASVVSPYGAQGAAQVSRDGTVAFAQVHLAKEAVHVTPAQAKRFVDAARSADGAGVEVEVGGQAAKEANQPQVSSTGIGAAAALVVLVLVFGSLLAASTPLLTAGLALGVGTAVIGLLSHLIGMATFSSELSLLIGLGVGVDYALFIVTRTRQGIQRGKAPEDAIVDAVDTSGRAVLFAGIIVCIALLGMFALGVSFLYGVAIAASIAVGFTVLASLTLLPALLRFIGPRVLSRRQRRALAESGPVHAESAPGFWARWSGALTARPAAFAAVAAILLVVIAIPFLGMRLGSSDSGSDPSGSTTRKAYDLLAKGFGPGYNGPLQLVAKIDTPAERATFARVRAAVASTSGVVAVTRGAELPARGGGVVAIANAYPKGSPQDASTTALLHTLRGRVVPAAEAGSALRVLVGGQTAIFEDFSRVLANKLPLFIGVVVALSFLLLMMVFRSLLIPALAAVMNLLSAGAAFGVITAVFQHGWGASLLGIDKTGPIEAFVPVMMFAILFGLSMDYEVFLVSRIYEEWHRTGDNRAAIARGLAATGRTITAAAAIMVLVFGSFILGGERVIELFGLGLASAVALDAAIVRSALVPALMLLSGEANWRIPRWLDRRLPRMNVEGDVDHGDDDEDGGWRAAGAATAAA